MKLAEKAFGILSLIYPPCCEACRGAVEYPHYLCNQCAAAADRIEGPCCMVCSEPFYGAITGAFQCGNCRNRQFRFSCAVARYRSTGVVRDFIHRFKYWREFHLRHPLAEWAAEALEDDRIRAEPVDALVPVPLFIARQRHREFNQAAEIARLVGARAGIPVADCMVRTRNTTSQVTHDRKGRMENLRNAFELRQIKGVRGRRLVLVDDVLTTGSTLDECARVLLKGGAASIRAITVARG
ncbi:MAG TPA: ComF family protein [Chthoniobacteraceae bacterium]|jgi:ComF family protein|nr:ComF family protein [Chthoniobacteraceae bacterium]